MPWKSGQERIVIHLTNQDPSLFSAAVNNMQFVGHDWQTWKMVPHAECSLCSLLSISFIQISETYWMHCSHCIHLIASHRAFSWLTFRKTCSPSVPTISRSGTFSDLSRSPALLSSSPEGACHLFVSTPFSVRLGTFSAFPQTPHPFSDEKKEEKESVTCLAPWLASQTNIQKNGF